MYQVQLDRSQFPPQDDGPLRDVAIGDLLREAAARWPDREALVEANAVGTTGRTWTYAQLLADSDRLARALLTRFEPCERIAIWAPNAPEWALLEYAAALAGLVVVTVNPAYQARELAYVLKQSKAVGLFLVSSHRGNPMAQIAAEVTKEIPDIREVTNLDDHFELFQADSLDCDLPMVEPSAPLQIQYTSGTTGSPKGVVLSHHSLANNSRFVAACLRLPLGVTTLCPVPLFHTSGCCIMHLSMQCGARFVLMRQFDADAVLDLIESLRVYLIFAVPTMVIGMAEAHRRRPRDLSALEVVTSGGATVAPELVREVRSRFGADQVVCYGQTESSPLLTMTRRDDTFDDCCNTVGQAIPHTELAILDSNDGTVLPCGAVGEICARGYALMLGYNDDPSATAKAIDKNGWLHTGDLGTMDARGFLRITGRMKEMIIRGGENLFPAEIENVLLEHPSVAEVAVVGVPDDDLGEAVAAFVRPAQGSSLDPAVLKSHCRAQLAAYKTPAHWIGVETWPLTGSGKIQKFELRDRWVATLSKLQAPTA